MSHTQLGAAAEVWKHVSQEGVVLRSVIQVERCGRKQVQMQQQQLPAQAELPVLQKGGVPDGTEKGHVFRAFQNQTRTRVDAKCTG